MLALPAVRARLAAVRSSALGLLVCTLVPFTLAATSSKAGPEAAPAQSFAISLSGNYLAGRFAGRQRETEAAAAYYAKALGEDPDNAFILERSFLLEVSAGHIEQAASLAAKLIKHDNGHRIAHLVLGLRHFQFGRYKRARENFDSAFHGSIGQLTSSLLSAWAFQAESRTDEAVAALKAIENTDTFGIFGPYHLALINDLGGRQSEAAKQYARAYDASASSLRVVQAYGSFLERTGHSDKAAEIYKTFLKASPEQALLVKAVERIKSGGKAQPLVRTAGAGAAEALFGISSALTEESSIDIALIYVQLTLYANSNLTIARSLLGDIYSDTKRREKAIESYEMVPAESPLRRNADIHIADNLDKLDRVDEARTRLESLIAQYPKDRLPLMVMGNLLRNREKFAEASGYYGKAIALIPKIEQNHWRVFYSRGITYERSKQWPKAEVDFLKALELFPDQPLVLNYLGYSWVEKGLNLQRAMKMIRKAVELRANDGYIVDSLGWAHYKLKEYDDAVRHLEQAVELRPDDPTINDHLGDALWRVGRKLEARFQWGHAKNLKPEPDALMKIEEKLKNGLPDEEAEKATSSSSSQDKS